MVFGDIIEKYYDDLEKHEKEPYWYDMPRKIETIIDPSAASFIALLKKRGWCKVRPAINDVENGIRDTAVAMQSGKIKVSDKIKEWADEMGGYVWDDKSEDEKPVKVNDHYADSTRYFVETKRIVKPMRDR